MIGTMSEPTDQTGLTDEGEGDRGIAADHDRDGAAENMPDPDEQLARAAAAAGPYSTLGAPPVRTPNKAGRLVWTVVALVAIVLAAVYGPGFVKRLGELRTQQAVSEYVSPPKLVVYEEQPAGAAELLSKGGGYFALPLPQDSAVAVGPPIAGHAAEAWREFRRWAFPKSPEPAGALLFLHERQTVAGVRGIVAVEADRSARRLRVSFIHRGSYTSGPSIVADGVVKPPPKEGMIVLSAGRDPFESKLPPADEPAARADLRFFAGRPDPQNWSHFVIPYELDGYAGELEMWVADESTFHYLDRRFAKSSG